jgi:hypothetical protein
MSILVSAERMSLHGSPLLRFLARNRINSLRQQRECLATRSHEISHIHAGNCNSDRSFKRSNASTGGPAPKAPVIPDADGYVTHLASGGTSG